MQISCGEYIDNQLLFKDIDRKAHSISVWWSVKWARLSSPLLPSALPLFWFGITASLSNYLGSYGCKANTSRMFCFHCKSKARNGPVSFMCEYCFEKNNFKKQITCVRNSHTKSEACDCQGILSSVLCSVHEKVNLLPVSYEIKSSKFKWKRLHTQK